MGSKAIVFVGLFLAIVLLFTSEVTARDLAETSTSTEQSGGIDDEKHGGGWEHGHGGEHGHHGGHEGGGYGGGHGGHGYGGASKGGSMHAP